MARFLPRWRLPPDGPQRTAFNAIIAGGLLVSFVIIGSHACSSQWAVKPAMERYVKLGPRAGSVELERELLAAHPPGSDVGPLFARLSRLGFDCGASVEPGRGGECRFRTGRLDRRIVTTTVEVEHDGARVGGIAARMVLSAP